MADAIVQLPYTGTTSGDLLDATSLVVGANTVKRERVVIGNDASTAVAIVTTSGALTVVRTTAVSLSSAITVDSITTTIFGVLSATAAVGVVPATSSQGLMVQSTQPVVITSGTVTLSSAIGVSSGLITLTGTNTVTLSSATSLSSGTVTLSSNPTVITASSGVVQVLTSGTYLVNATSTSGLLVDVSRGVSLAFFNFTATSSGLKSLVAASGSNKVKVVSYVIVSNSTQEVSFYSSNTAIGGSSSAPMVLSSYSGVSAVGDRTSWLLETSAAGSLQVHLGNSGIISGHGSYIYEV